MRQRYDKKLMSGLLINGKSSNKYHDNETIFCQSSNRLISTRDIATSGVCQYNAHTCKRTLTHTHCVNQMID